MTWNHRLLAFTVPGEDKPYLEVRSVYYDEKGEPNSYGGTGHAVGGDDLPSVQRELEMHQAAILKPILWADEDKFPAEYK